jgi:hypothetical protein
VRTSKQIAFGSLLCLGLAAVACGGGGGDGPASGSTSTAVSAVRPSSTAKLTIVSPKIGAVVKGSTVDIVVDLQGATIVAATSTDLQPDEGHLHVILDDQLLTMTAKTETLIPDVAPGHHILKVEFVANDHGPFFPNVVAVSSFEVKA